MRNWIIRILIVGFLWFFVSRFTEVERLAGVLAQGKWEWIAVAFILQIIYYAVYTCLYQSAFSTVGVKSKWRELWPLIYISIFVNVLAPTGGTSGAAVFVDDASRRGESPAKATAGTLLVVITELGSFIGILFVGLAYLYTHHNLKNYEIIASIILSSLITLLGSILLIGLWFPQWIQKLLSYIQWLAGRISGWFKRKNFLGDNWADNMALEFSEAAAAIHARPGRLARTIVIALVVHAIDLITLYIIFLAFGQNVGFGGLVAGYSMAILFWIVSPTPQGVGVVEAVIAMVYTSLGVPGSKALVIALAFRGLSFWLPLLIGFVALRKIRTFRVEQKVHAKTVEVHLVAILATVVGLIDILSAVMPALKYRIVLLDPVISSGARHGFRLAAALAGFGLIMLSRGLWRQKRIAWTIAIGLLALSLVSHMLKGLDYEESLVVVILIAWLWSLRTNYQAVSDPPSVRQGLIVLASSLIFTIFYGTIGFYLLDRHFIINYSLSAAIKQTLAMFTEFYSPGLEPTTGFGRYFATSIYVVGAITFAYSLILLLRPVFLRKPGTIRERDQARSIIENYGRSSLAEIALLPDKSYFFTSGGSVIAFVARSGIGLALGDPIGPESDVPPAISEFRKFCSVQDWRPAFYQVMPDYIDIYKSLKLNVLCIGHEATVNLNEFSLEGGQNKSVRTSINKLSKAGYTAELVSPPFSETFIEEIRAVSDEWLVMMHGSEKKFSLGWFDEDYIRLNPVMLIKSSEGAIVAFANIISEYKLNEITIDLMRRTKDAPGGTMDFLFVSLFEWAKSECYNTFNLGLSPLAGVGEHSDDPVVEKALRFIYHHVNQFYSFKGLHNFKEKFHPSWSPRYLIYDGRTNLLPTAYSIVSADSGEGLLLSYLAKRSRQLVEKKSSANTSA